jgi:hypothetical protein
MGRPSARDRVSGMLMTAYFPTQHMAVKVDPHGIVSFNAFIDIEHTEIHHTRFEKNAFSKWLKHNNVVPILHECNQLCPIGHATIGVDALVEKWPCEGLMVDGNINNGVMEGRQLGEVMTTQDFAQKLVIALTYEMMSGSVVRDVCDSTAMLSKSANIPTREVRVEEARLRSVSVCMHPGYATPKVAAYEPVEKPKVLVTKVKCRYCGRNNNLEREVCASCGGTLHHENLEDIVKVYE